MNDTSPLAGLLALAVLCSFIALVAGAVVLGLVFTAAGIACCRRIRQKAVCSQPPRPTITYLPEARMDEPLIRLQRGQTATVPWPHPLQVLLPAGVRLQILEATPERVRVIAA